MIRPQHISSAQSSRYLTAGGGGSDVNTAPFITSNVISFDGSEFSGPYTYNDADGDFENNEPPIAIDLDLSVGIPEVGQVQTVSFEFYSPSGYEEGTHSYQWYRSDATDGTGEEPIDGATSINYTTVEADINHYLRCEVTVRQTAPAPANGNSSGTYTTGYSPLIGDGFTLDDIGYHLVLDHEDAYDDGDLHWPNAGSVGGELVGTGASKPTLSAGQVDFDGTQWMDGTALIPNFSSNGITDIIFKAKWDDLTIERVLFAMGTDGRIFYNTTGPNWRMLWTNAVTSTAAANTTEYIFRISKQYPDVIFQVYNASSGTTPIIDEILAGINTAGTPAGDLRIGARLTGDNPFIGSLKYLCALFGSSLSGAQVLSTVDYMQNN